MFKGGLARQSFMYGEWLHDGVDMQTHSMLEEGMLRAARQGLGIPADEGYTRGSK